MLSPVNIQEGYIASLHSAFRAVTYAAHQRIDRHPMLVPLLRPGLTWIHYDRVLRVFLNLYRSLQPCVVAEINRLGNGCEYALGDRIEWLQCDLAYLAGCCDGVALSSLDIQWRLPSIDGAPAVVGALYVIEGSTLGSQIIAKQLKASLGVDCNHGARFFHAFGNQTSQNWSRYWQYAADQCPPEGQILALSAAVALFDAIERGLNEAWARWQAQER